MSPSLDLPLPGNTPAFGGLRTYVPPHRPRPSDASAAKETPRERQIRQVAASLVAQTFYGPMFRMMRESPFRSEVMNGGRGGEAFATLLDQQLVSRMSRRSDPLVDAIVRRLAGATEAQAVARSQPPETTTAADVRVGRHEVLR